MARGRASDPYAALDVTDYDRHNRDVIVTVARKQAPLRFIRYASEKLKGDREIAQAAVKQNALVLLEVSEDLKVDRPWTGTLFSQRHCGTPAFCGKSYLAEERRLHYNTTRLFSSRR